MDTYNRTLNRFLGFFTVLLVITALYFGRSVLMPLALASLFTFMLNPLVKMLCRLHIPRAASVCIVTLVTFAMLASVAWLLGRELTKLADELPNYRTNIQNRVKSLQQIGNARVIQKLRHLVGEVKQPNQEKGETPNEASPGESASTPPPAEESGVMKALNMVVPTLANGMGFAAVVILFVIFMLLRLEDIGVRIARLVGYSRVTLTTKALDESSDRISRYLLMQATINSIYGVLLSIALAVVGLPYVILWGVLAALFRFIPYVGPWVVAVLPISMSLAVFDGWTLPLVVIALICTLELTTNMILEPMLYGQSVGVSDFALLVAIAFWTWLWGGIGLVLATPLTVCIVVFCKYIPSLGWVDLMMGENPPPQPHLRYYQHHLADNESDGEMIVEESLRTDGYEKTLDNILLPALAMTHREEALGKLDQEEAANVYQSMRSAFPAVREIAAELPSADKDQKNDADPPAEQIEVAPRPTPTIKVFARALQGEADAQALEMLATTLPETVELEVSSEPRLIGELVRQLGELQPEILCISALPSHTQSAANTCRRVRSKLPSLKILVCRWGLLGEDVDSKPLLESGATWVVSSIKEAREVIEAFVGEF